MTLSEWLEKQDMSDATFGGRIGVTRQSVHRYKNKVRIPQWHIIELIRRETKGAVTVLDFVPTETSPPCNSANSPAGLTAGGAPLEGV